ncbi:tyrosine-type recombinase/integrase [Leifsonia sp. RAF41]|uniref:tyrosine-type recombinase/integrase n=1 Tax=Leifsonia sp. RAF41 TaxID=3233056 RepID=UPI003F9C625F
MAGKKPNGTGSVYRRRDGRYVASYFAPGAGAVRKRVSVYADTAAAAHQKLHELAQRAERGEPVADRSLTVSRFLDYWLEEVVPIKTRPRTAELYELTVRRDIRPLLGPIKLTELSVSDVQRAINHLVSIGKSARSVHKFRSVLSSALSRAVREERVMRNVARLVDLPVYRRQEIHPWSAAEAARFLEAARGHMWEVGYQLLVLYGMRRGEVIGLRWSSIDFQHNTFTIDQQIQRINGRLEAGPVKTRAGRRTLPLLPAVRDNLLALAQRDGIELSDALNTSELGDRLVLASKTGAAVEPGNFARTFYLLSERAGVPRITVHHTRHTAATLLKSLAVPARDAQLILGHSNVTTTQEIYQHADVDVQRAALESLEAKLRTTVEKSPVANSGGAETPLLSRQQRTVDNSDSHVATEANENGHLTEMEMAEFDGGSGGDRTRDILLKRHIPTLFAELPTTVIKALHTRTSRRIVGRVAVKTAVKTDSSTVSSLPFLNDLLATRKDCRDALTERLRQRSFPLNLVPEPQLSEEA